VRREELERRNRRLRDRHAEALRTQAEINLIVGRFELARARVQFARAIAEEHAP
jgi:hypothetical protein